MNMKSKVNLSSVTSLKNVTGEARDYSSSFEKGVACLEEFCHYLSELSIKIKDSISNLILSQEKLALKISNIEEMIARLITQINKLQEKMSCFENKLSRIPESITVSDDQGEIHKVSNPAYYIICGQIATLREEIKVVEAELFPHQQRLERAQNINGQISAQIDAMNGVAYSLEEKKNNCKQLKTEYEIIKHANFRRGSTAYEKLGRTERIIEEYLQVRMKLEASLVYEHDSNLTVEQLINIKININKVSQEERKIIINSQNYNESIDIPKHDIKLDEFGRVCEYDGKRYGGKYNTYEDRIGITLLDNTVLGMYIGERGESKFIPSEMTTEGVIAKAKLLEYGLDGIIYRNAEPDFSVCAEAFVIIEAMTKNRDDYYDSNGEKQMGNFSQADIKYADLWNLQEIDGKIDWNARDVFKYRHEHKLSWHEKCDAETMVLISYDIHNFFRHSGGVSECKKRDASNSNSEGEFDE